MKKYFKPGDKIVVLQDFPNTFGMENGNNNREGIFVRYTNRKLDACDTNIYHYIVRIPNGPDNLVCHDIQLLSMSKYKFSDVVSENSKIWVKCYNVEQANKIRGNDLKSYDYTSWPIFAYIHGRSHGFNYNCCDPSYGDPIIEYNEIDFEEEFILPEKWCIKVTNENQEDITNYFHRGYTAEIDYYLYVDNNQFHYKSIVKDEYYTEITFEQFKKYVLKQNNMEKKIIGYKLIKPEYESAAHAIMGNTGFSGDGKTDIKLQDTINLFKNAGVLDLWFKPVYEEEFKVGDWIYFLKAFDGSNIGHVGQITNIKPDSYKNSQWLSYSPANIGGGFRIGGNGYFYGKDFRLATPEEIKAVTKLEIGGYKAEKTSKGIKFGCQEFSIEELKTIKKLFNSELQTKLIIRGVEIKLSLIDKLINL